MRMIHKKVIMNHTHKFKKGLFFQSLPVITVYKRYTSNSTEILFDPIKAKASET